MGELSGTSKIERKSFESKGRCPTKAPNESGSERGGKKGGSGVGMKNELTGAKESGYRGHNQLFEWGRTLRKKTQGIWS